MPKWISGEPTEEAHRSALGAGGAGVAAEELVIEEDAMVTDSRLPELRGGRNASVRRCNRMARAHQRGAFAPGGDCSDSGQRRCLGIRTAVREADEVARDRDVEQAREDGEAEGDGCG